MPNNHVSTSKHYQLSPKQKLMQTNSLVTSMTFVFLSANSKTSVKLFIVQKHTKICQCSKTFNHNLQISYRFVSV